MGGCHSSKKPEEQQQIITNIQGENERSIFQNYKTFKDQKRLEEAKINLFDDFSLQADECSSIVEYEYLPTSSKSPDRAKDPLRSSLDIIALSIQKNYKKCDIYPKINNPLVEEVLKRFGPFKFKIDIEGM